MRLCEVWGFAESLAPTLGSSMARNEGIAKGNAGAVLLYMPSYLLAQISLN